MKKKYQITLRTIYGLLTIDDIEAKTEDEAIAIAERKAQDELDCAKIDEVYCYEQLNGTQHSYRLRFNAIYTLL